MQMQISEGTSIILTFCGFMRQVLLEVYGIHTQASPCLVARTIGGTISACMYVVFIHTTITCSVRFLSHTFRAALRVFWVLYIPFYSQLNAHHLTPMYSSMCASYRPGSPTSLRPTQPTFHTTSTTSFYLAFGATFCRTASSTSSPLSRVSCRRLRKEEGSGI